MSKTILHIDMDAFFASVEQLDHPEYRGKPVIVGADPQGGRGRGVVSTASYEAREYGIHSAMPISQAYYRCPNGIFVPPRGKRYSELSHQIMEIFYDFTPVIEPISIDEAFLDLTGTQRLMGTPESIARCLKQRIKTETGLTASVGLAPNKFIAKIASDLEKPDGLVIVNEGEEKAFLHPLPISKMWGIGKKSEPHFRKLNINTVGDLAELPVKKVVKIFGKNGLHFWQLANGIDKRVVETYSAAKSMSHEVTFMTDTDCREQLELVLFEIAEKLGKSLRKKGWQAKTVTLKIRLSDFSTFTRSKSLADFFDDSDLIRQTALSLYRQFDCQGQKVRLIGVNVSHFDTGLGQQLNLLDKEQTSASNSDKVIDLIEEKFGKGFINRATLMQGHGKRNRS